MRSWKTWAALAFVLVIGVVASMLLRSGPADVATTAAPEIAVARVLAPERENVIVATTLEPARDVAVRTPRRGAVQGVEVDSGERVVAGDLIVRLEQSSQQASLMSARAEVAQVEAELERARERAGVVPGAEDDIETLEERLVRVRDQLDAARAALEALNIRAPFAGTVDLAPELSPGTVLTRDERVATLSNAEELMLRFRLSRGLAAGLRRDMELEVHAVDGDATATARITTLTAEAGGGTPMTSVLARVVTGQASFDAGTDVRVTLPIADERLALVPAAALVEDDRGTRVFRIEQDFARATRVQTTQRGTTASDDGRVRVRGALEPGDLVAVDSLGQLRDGLRVRAASAPAD